MKERRSGKERRSLFFPSPAEVAASLGTPRIHQVLFVRHRLSTLAVTVALYAATVLLWGPDLAISSNYLVIFPVITAALGYGLRGGLLAGVLGLPANLLLFSLLGHPEYSPASKVIAEISGLVIGGALGYLADYYRGLAGEIHRRALVEESLRKAVEERELLLRELDHRVKNNLNVMKSLVQLQKNRSGDPDFLAAADELMGRIFALALVHDHLRRGEGGLGVAPEDYFPALAVGLERAWADRGIKISCEVDAPGLRLSPDMASDLGLVANEAVTNAAKHAAGARVRLVFMALGPECSLVVEDEPDGCEDTPPAPRATAEGVSSGLGMKIVSSLANRLGGRVRIGQRACGQGTRFELHCPRPGAILTDAAMAPRREA